MYSGPVGFGDRSIPFRRKRRIGTLYESCMWILTNSTHADRTRLYIAFYVPLISPKHSIAIGASHLTSKPLPYRCAKNGLLYQKCNAEAFSITYICRLFGIPWPSLQDLNYPCYLLVHQCESLPSKNTASLGTFRSQYSHPSTIHNKYLGYVEWMAPPTHHPNPNQHPCMPKAWTMWWCQTIMPYQENEKYWHTQRRFGDASAKQSHPHTLLYILSHGTVSHISTKSSTLRLSIAKKWLVKRPFKHTVAL